MDRSIRSKISFRCGHIIGPHLFMILITRVAARARRLLAGIIKASSLPLRPSANFVTLLFRLGVASLAHVMLERDRLVANIFNFINLVSLRNRAAHGIVTD